VRELFDRTNQCTVATPKAMPKPVRKEEVLVEAA
jgi:hypothetical protein